MNKPIRVRFAPSPTGDLHLGNVRTAIFNWLFAKHHQGKFLLRIEDTDIERSTPEYAQGIIKSLQWLGMPSDEPVVFQAQNKEHHLTQAQMLIEQDLAYRCICTKEELLDLRQESGLGYVYPGTCRDKNYTDSAQPHVIRFKVSNNLPSFLSYQDAVIGQIELETKLVDDFVLIRQDLWPTYNFAATLDDIAMQISHVIRGQDHVNNTFKQILLYQALGADIPVFAHLPMILGPSRARLSKRDGAVALKDYQHQGFLPAAIINYLARLGWSCGDAEILSTEELVAKFSLEGISTTNAVFDLTKLTWLNGVYLHRLSAEEFTAHLAFVDYGLAQNLASALPSNLWEKLFALYQPRSQTLTELAQVLLNIILHQKNPNHDLPPELLVQVKRFLKEVKEQNLGSSEAVKLAMDKFIAESTIKSSDFFQAVRLFLTGSKQGPSVAEIIVLLGK